MKQYELEDVGINSNSLVLNENLDTISLMQIISSFPKLVFVFKNIDCQSCIDEVIKKIKGLNKGLGSEKIVILCEFNDYRGLVAFKRMHQMENKFYTFGHFPNSFQRQLDQPYLFILDSDFQQKSFFLPESTYPEMINFYFKQISNKLK